MASISIRVEGDAPKLLSKMQDLSNLDKKSLNEALAEMMRESTLERFKQGRGPSGKRWKTSIRAAQSGGKTLIDTAQLRNSIKSAADESGGAVGTNVIHAATHQLGASNRTIRAKTAKGLRFRVNGHFVTKQQVQVSIPARPFLGVSDDDLEEIQAMIEDFVRGDS